MSLFDTPDDIQARQRLIARGWKQGRKNRAGTPLWIDPDTQSSMSEPDAIARLRRIEATESRARCSESESEDGRHGPIRGEDPATDADPDTGTPA